MGQYLDTLDDSKSKVLDQYDALRAIWGDILQGFSYIHKEKVYIKHLDDVDHSHIAKIQTDLTLEFLDMGVPTRQERLDFITKESEEWNQNDEDQITSSEYFILDNEQTWKDMQIPSQKEHLGKLLEQHRENISKKKREREDKIGTVAETKAQKIANSYYLFFSMYKDRALTKPLWESLEKFDELEDGELAKHVWAYNEALAPFTGLNFQKISAMPFTLNLASYCKDQGMFFYGKAVTQFTNFQLGVFTKVMKNTFILRETKSEGSPPINNELTMKSLLDWYDQEYSMIIAQNQSNSAAVQTTHHR